MSLSSYLLGKSHSKGDKAIDEDLDALLRSSVPTPPTSSETNTGAKRRRGPLKDPFPTPVKRKKSVNTKEQSSLRRRPTTNVLPLPSKSTKGGKGEEVSKNREKMKRTPEESDDEEAGAGPEYAYEHKVRSGKQIATDSSSDKDQQSGPSDSEENTPQLANKTAVRKDRRSKAKPKHVYCVPPDETKEQRDARTIFLGNVPMEVAKGKSALKDLERHILSHVPGAKIESMRLRSVAFQRPTSTAPAPAPRVHDLERTAEWRAAKGDGDGVSTPPPRSRQLGPGDKKKIAFIKHEFHAEADAVTVYVVFAYGADLAPDEAAKGAVAALDNMPYMGRTLRADAVESGGIGDPKRTVFVGSLDFASHEEDLRVFFEGVVSAERGPRGAHSDSDDEEGAGDPNAHGAKPNTWVTRVRIVRDKDTQLGKGFAYVQFADRECVDEILALEPGKLKFAKRKLRVERCKTLPRSLNNNPRDPRVSTVSPSRSARPTTKLTPATIPIPKGNPDLGAQLAHLPKAERKAAKAIDPERVARRLAKKKARNSLQVPEQRKDRVRVRKNAVEHKASARQKKTRVRSERSVARRNTKK